MSKRALVGGLPMDHVICTVDRTPRSAVEAFAARWRQGAVAMLRGEQLPGGSVGNADHSLELAPLIAATADLLDEWCGDDRLWE